MCFKNTYKIKVLSVFGLFDKKTKDCSSIDFFAIFASIYTEPTVVVTISVITIRWFFVFNLVKQSYYHGV